MFTNFQEDFFKMTIDLLHNKIVADTVTDGFKRSIAEVLVPALSEIYGESMSGIQMYEDHLADGFLRDGTFLYPMTVLLGDEQKLHWIGWSVDEKSFSESVPFAYTGEELIDFDLEPSVPLEFETAMIGRSIYCEEGLIKINVHSTSPSPTFLSGKYSQTFIDEMARQITPKISELMGVSGLAESGIELELIFAPATYMEHHSENVTYRRLLMTDKSAAPRDFWIKWTNRSSSEPYTVSDSPVSDEVEFEIGEGVAQKIREKEYRYLIRTNNDKYQKAMGRRNITEWRDLIKRAVKRGRLTKVVREIPLSKETLLLNEKLACVLGLSSADVSAPDTSAEAEERNMDIAREFARAAGIDVDTEPLAEDEGDETNIESELALASVEDAEGEAELEPSADGAERIEPSADDSAEFDLGADGAEEFGIGDDGGEIEFAAAESEETGEPDGEDEDELMMTIRLAREAVANRGAEEPLDSGIDIFGDEPDEDAIDFGEETDDADEVIGFGDGEGLAISGEDDTDEENDEYEADDESEYEADEVEFEADDADFETDDAENEADEAEFEAEDAEFEADEAELEAGATDDVIGGTADAKDTTAADERSAITEEIESKLREGLEAKIRLEYEQRARESAEAEMIKLRREQEQLLIENRRLEAQAKKELEERKRISEQRKLEEARLRAQIETQVRAEAKERERLAEAARMAVEEQRRLETEKLLAERERMEQERRAAEERARQEAEARLKAERELEAERIRAASQQPVEEEEPEDNYTYIAKNVKLLFRYSVDPNITGRIHEIIKATLEYYGKEKLHIRVRASVPDKSSVVLEFLEFPKEEMELLQNIIKVLGNSGIGIAKAIVEDPKK